MKIVIVAEGPVKIIAGGNVEGSELRGKGIIITIEGESFKITITPLEGGSKQDARGERGEKIDTKHRGRALHIVLDQMFKGFSDILDRELPPGVIINEVLGKGIEEPIRVGRVTKWPAHDDYDVFKIVEQLSDKGGKVVFFTGDKRLARQVASLGRDNVIVEYLPPNEFPGKEALARKIIESAINAMGSNGED